MISRMHLYILAAGVGFACATFASPGGAGGDRGDAQDAEVVDASGRTDETNTFHLALPPEKAERLRASVGEDLVQRSDAVAHLWYRGEGAFSVNVVFQLVGVGNRFRIEHRPVVKPVAREPATAAGEYVARGTVEMRTSKGAAAIDCEVYMAPLDPKEAFKEAKIVPAKARVVWSDVRPIEK